MVRVVVVSDIRLYQEGLTQALARDGRIEVVGSGSSVEDAWEMVPSLAPDVLLLDLGTPGVLANVRDLAGVGPKVVVLGVQDAELDILACAEAGASGYALRDATLDELIGCIAAVGRGDLCCSPRMAGVLLRRVAALAGERHDPRTPGQMTGREAQVLALVDQGLSNKEIAARLHIEVATVKHHIHNILEKLGVRRRGEAAALARRAPRRRAVAPAI